MNVFIILSVLVIVVGVILLVASPPALFTLNWIYHDCAEFIS